jgi:SAM-dependent methyltransferase
MTVVGHYENLLAPYYSWIFGGIEKKIKENEVFFQSLGLSPSGGGRAFDLGAGSGFQSIPLARLGFQVSAVDLSPTLLAELTANACGLNIKTFRQDLLDFLSESTERAELILCMGDTLTHLESHDRVSELIRLAGKRLEPGGRLILTFRNYMTPLEGEARFIPVRGDDEKFFTCFLEYFDTFVKVFDIVHERRDGQWAQRISSYRKLRLDPAALVGALANEGFAVEQSTRQGMVTIVARHQAAD